MTAPEVAADEPALVWTVYASWRAGRVLCANETRQTYRDWPTARRQARRLFCLSGVRYVSVQGPGDVVVAEVDEYTQRWREYPHPWGPVTTSWSPTASPAPGGCTCGRGSRRRGAGRAALGRAPARAPSGES